MSLFGGRTRQRRRRPGSVIRRSPDELHQNPIRRRVGTMQALACAAIVVICITMVMLIWINTERAVHEQAEDLRGRVEAAITAQDATLTMQAQHELQMVDQSLSVLQAAWDQDPDTFNLANWRKLMPALTIVTDDLFIANEQHVIVQDINPAAVGQGIGSAYASFANGSLEPILHNGPAGRDNTMVVGELGAGAVTRQYLMYLVRQLAKPPGWLIGASYRSTALTAVFASAGLGQGGLAALIDTHRGGVQALVGTAALRPRLDIGSTPMYNEMLARTDGGIWVGRTAMDGVNRIIAFRRIPDRDLIVAVGVVTDTAMAPADLWAAGARSLATMASGLVVAICGTLLWELWHWRSTRRRRRALTLAESLVTAMRSDLVVTRLQASVGASQVQAMLGGVSEGVATIDAEHHLVVWNPRFAALSGLPEDSLREGQPLDDVLRQLVQAGRFGAAEDVEAEVTRLVTALRQEAGWGEVAVTAPDGTHLVLRAQATPDGGLVLILGPAASMPEPVHVPVPMPATIEETATADPVEW
jgi:PAS domain-containing protein